MPGGKFRDKIRCYADTTESHDPKVYGQRLKARRDQGFTWLKMDLGVDLGALTMPAGTRLSYGDPVQHMFTGTEITPKGVALMGEYVAAIREQVGYDIPLASDHFGHIGVNSCIRIGKEMEKYNLAWLEKYNLAWLEDRVPWQYTDLLKKISGAVDIPILRRGHLSERAIHRTGARTCTGHRAARSRHVGWNPGDEEDRRPLPGTRCAAGDALRRHAGFVHGQRALRGGDREFPGNGEPLGGHPVVERSSRRRGEANRQQGLDHGAGQTGPLQEPGYFEPSSQWNVDRTNDRQWS
jgi:hypothetical protein